MNPFDTPERQQLQQLAENLVGHQPAMQQAVHLPGGAPKQATADPSHNLTVVDIALLLEIYVTIGQSRSKPEERQRLFLAGLIDREDELARVTEKGAVYIQKGLLRVPLPVQQWRMP